jgi:chromosome segregation ATPase
MQNQMRSPVRAARKNSTYSPSERKVKLFFCIQISELEDIVKEKDNQMDLARAKINALQAQTYPSEGTLASLEEALTDRDKQIAQLRDQRDRAEKDFKEEKELHEREITENKMRMHQLENEVEKLQVRLDKAYSEKDKLEDKLERSQSELGKSKAELDKAHGDTSTRYMDHNEIRHKLTKAEMDNDRLR